MLENLLSNEFVISIDNHEDLVRFAELMCGPVKIRHGHLPFLVDDNSYFFIR